MQLQPIETAPSDDSQILGWDIINGYYVCVWDTPGRKWGNWYMKKKIGAWQEVVYPTHWMPLPEPPK